MADVNIRGVTKSYGNTEIIHGIDLDINDGEFVVIVGPSGCGKSTLLRMVAGLETITSGEIEIDGEVVNKLEPKDRNIAMVFQNYALYPHMSVFDNMAYGLRNRGVAREEIQRKVEEAADTLELNGLLQRKPSQLSGGQRQRVAMGRAIVRSPKVFLFDEPLSNLDAKLRVNMRIEIRRLQRELGITSIYVTHDQVEAMTLADRLVAMNAGRAEQVGAPMELYERPRTTFVGGFIGSPPMNFLSGMRDNNQLICAGSSLGTAPQTVPVTGTVTVGIRPEDFAIAEPGSDSIPATVLVTEPLGPETLVHASLDADKSLVTIRLHGTYEADIGDSIGLTTDIERVTIFDAEGNALE